MRGVVVCLFDSGAVFIVFVLNFGVGKGVFAVTHVWQLLKIWDISITFTKHVLISRERTCKIYVAIKLIHLAFWATVWLHVNLIETVIKFRVAKVITTRYIEALIMHLNGLLGQLSQRQVGKFLESLLREFDNSAWTTSTTQFKFEY